MIKQIIENNWLEARGVIAFYPANTVEFDDIELYTDETKTKVAATLHTLR
jgi:5-methyltetrahydrofolate--homocysteine methyltransferase